MLCIKMKIHGLLKQYMLNNYKYTYLHLCTEAVAIFFPLRMEWSNRIFFPFSQDYHLLILKQPIQRHDKWRGKNLPLVYK